jgi:hypothetical protein
MKKPRIILRWGKREVSLSDDAADKIDDKSKQACADFIASCPTFTIKLRKPTLNERIAWGPSARVRPEEN